MQTTAGQKPALATFHVSTALSDDLLLPIDRGRGKIDRAGCRRRDRIVRPHRCAPDDVVTPDHVGAPHDVVTPYYVEVAYSGSAPDNVLSVGSPDNAVCVYGHISGGVSIQAGTQ